MSQIILAIDTSCDDTSAAVVSGQEIWSNIIASQTELHRPYGGVFPTVAKQAHRENLEPTVQLALKRAGVKLNELESIAVTIGPGLAPALEIGLAYARQLAKANHLPLIPVNHLEGHLLSILARAKKRTQPVDGLVKLKSDSAHFSVIGETDGEPRLPALALLVSGGNTMLVLVEAAEREAPRAKIDTNDRQPRLRLTAHPEVPEWPWLQSGHLHYTLLGETLDDAAGECLDKVGRMLNLGYPAAPVVEQLAKLGNAARYAFPLPMSHSPNYDFSFAGLKTYARRFIEKNWQAAPASKQEIYDFSASLQNAVFRHLCHKLSKVLHEKPHLREVWLVGGVAANLELRKMMRVTLRQHATANKQPTPSLRVPYSKRLCQDNAAMIGVVAIFSNKIPTHT